ncbi:MAG TPA: dickkopf-related protein [Polyangiales bacterium]|nr:dickkopf-related protein [Polyangiales bacterium]
MPTTNQPVGTPCDDTLKCTQGDVCDASGRCAGSARSCDDAVACTSDACSEAATGDGCTHTLDAHSCLIGGSCFGELTPSPNSTCQLCDPTRATSAWSPVANTVRCAAPSCVGDQFTAAALCDGAGTCAPVTAVSCGNFVCATATSCTDSCSDDRECGTSSYCDKNTKKCVDNLPAGAACTANGQCSSGLACADGVCCESACGSKCETCNAPGFVGKCVNITFGDPENECPDGTSCRSGNQCVQDVQSIEPVTPIVDAGVPSLPGNDVLPVGARCDQDQACGLGFCRDGVCCASACEGACEGCNVLGATPGQCVAYSLGSDPENECAGVGGVCNGSNACAYYETRGSGSCAALPGVGGGPSLLDGLWVACALLVSRRKRWSATS